MGTAIVRMFMTSFRCLGLSLIWCAPLFLRARKYFDIFLMENVTVACNIGVTFFYQFFKTPNLRLFWLNKSSNMRAHRSAKMMRWEIDRTKKEGEAETRIRSVVVIFPSPAWVQRRVAASSPRYPPFPSLPRTCRRQRGRCWSPISSASYW